EGPDAIRLASFNFESYDFDYDLDLSEIAICDLGNMDLGADPTYAEETIKECIAFLPEDAVPIFLGGEHSITPPIAEGLAQKGSVGVLVLDAHLDLRESFGNTRYSHACASRRILEKKGIGAYASIGIRSGSKEEFTFAKEGGISYYTSREVHERGIYDVLERAIEKMNCEQIYLSIDLDAIDPAFAPAVGNPEPFGLSTWDVSRVVEHVAPTAVGLDINELTPAYDHGQTALLAARLARQFIARKAKS
ncbi:MAG TPA: agmatinase, partial [Methanothrix sp.]|nr:agmatinase [Methanothrix sp.]